jgi:hypothetical protein
MACLSPEGTYENSPARFAVLANRAGSLESSDKVPNGTAEHPRASPETVPALPTLLLTTLDPPVIFGLAASDPGPPARKSSIPETFHKRDRIRPNRRCSLDSDQR